MNRQYIIKCNSEEEFEQLKTIVSQEIGYLILTRHQAFNRPNSIHYQDKKKYKELTKQIKTLKDFLYREFHT